MLKMYLWVELFVSAGPSIEYFVHDCGSNDSYLLFENIPGNHIEGVAANLEESNQCVAYAVEAIIEPVS